MAGRTCKENKVKVMGGLVREDRAPSSCLLYHSPSSSHSRTPVNSHRWQSKGQQRPGRRKDLL